jgi:hypothetical protein
VQNSRLVLCTDASTEAISNIWFYSITKISEYLTDTVLFYTDRASCRKLHNNQQMYKVNTYTTCIINVFVMHVVHYLLCASAGFY